MKGHPSTTQPPLWEDNHRNLTRYLHAIVKFNQTETMRILAQEFGHPNLKVHFKPYYPLISAQGTSLNLIAARLGITKQAAHKTVNQIVKAGYAERIPSDTDRRSKLIRSTARGQSTLEDGLKAYASVERRLVDIISESKFNELGQTLASLNSALNLAPFPTPVKNHFANTHVGWNLMRLSEYSDLRLMEIISEERGHTNLKLYFEQVLALIGPYGIRMQEIAYARNISKQTVAVVIKELEDLGYVYRDVTRHNAKQQIIKLTKYGQAVINDWISCSLLYVDELAVFIGPKKMTALSKLISELYDNLLPSALEITASCDPELREIADKLTRTLGPERARSLGELLARK
jgi:DNA-binding MarR family transcriptional regulator